MLLQGSEVFFFADHQGNEEGRGEYFMVAINAATSEHPGL